MEPPAGGRPIEDDTVLRDASPAAVVPALEEHHRDQQRSWAHVRKGKFEDGVDMFRFVSGLPVAFANGVLAARLAPEDADRRIEEALEVFGSHGVPATWWVGPLSRPPDLGGRLQAHGFRRREDVPWLALDLRALRKPGPAPQGLRILRVRDERTQAHWRDAMSAGFGLERPVADALDELSTKAGFDGPWRRFTGLLGDRPVASAGLMLFGGLAGVYNVATRPEMRRRGFGTAMTMAAVREALAIGYRVAVLGTSEMGRGIYERMGFREVCRFGIYQWHPAGLAETAPAMLHGGPPALGGG
jgi:ribosomal protein S18 acetylase RimI-like enzyme